MLVSRMVSTESAVVSVETCYLFRKRGRMPETRQGNGKVCSGDGTQGGPQGKRLLAASTGTLEVTVTVVTLISPRARVRADCSKCVDSLFQPSHSDVTAALDVIQGRLRPYAGIDTVRVG